MEVVSLSLNVLDAYEPILIDYPGIAHSEQNEHTSDTVHFLQIWATPWRRGLTPQYHTVSFDEELKQWTTGYIVAFLWYALRTSLEPSPLLRLTYVTLARICMARVRQVTSRRDSTDT